MGENEMWTAIIISVGAAMLGFAIYGSANIRSGLYVKALYRRRTDRKVVALTFDDGPHPLHTPAILDILKQYDVHGTFFIVGEKAEKHPEIVKRIVGEGHLIGNHTYSHSPCFPFAGTKAMGEEFGRCDDALEKITGAKPNLMRPPFGVTNPPLARANRNKGYTIAGWDVRSFDTAVRKSREKVAHRVCRRLRPGSVILLHDDRPKGDTLLTTILDYLRQNDYNTERFDKLFEL